MSEYRPCVAALLVNAQDQVLVAERIEFHNSWQFPQGGREAGEDPVQTLYRELEEEISVRPEHYRVLEQKDGYRYQHPRTKRNSSRYIGQEQTYFRCRLTAPDTVINVATKEPEFRNWKWVYPHEFDLLWLPEFKRDVYQRVLNDFFQVTF